jgi:hypothetical protein
MRRNNIFLAIFLLSITILAEKVEQAKKTSQEKDVKQETPKLLNDEQVDKIIRKVMQSDLSGKSAAEVKRMISEEIKKQKEKHRPEIYHHVHKSTEDAEDAGVEEYVADEAVKLGKKKGIFQMKHKLNELEDEEELEETKKNSLKTVDPETAQLQKKYETLLKEILKQNADESKPKPTELELVREVEKRMKDKQTRHPVKTSDRMIAYMEEMLRNLNDGTLKNADKFDMKGFVSSVFGHYRAKHEAEKERKRRIVALKEHLAKDGHNFEHQPNFYDEFYVPNQRGYDSKFNMRNLNVNHDPNEEPSLMSSILPAPTQLDLSEDDRKKYLGYEHHSDHSHLPLNMPFVAPDTTSLDLLDSLGLDNDAELKVTNSNSGFMGKLVDSVQGLFNKD